MARDYRCGSIPRAARARSRCSLARRRRPPPPATDPPPTSDATAAAATARPLHRSDPCAAARAVPRAPRCLFNHLLNPSRPFRISPRETRRRNLPSARDSPATATCARRPFSASSVVVVVPPYSIPPVTGYPFLRSPPEVGP